MPKIILTIFLGLISFLGTNAQTWEVGGFLGGSSYLGDLNQKDFYKLYRPAYGAIVKRNFDGYWSLKFSLLRGRVGANDAKSAYQQERDRNLRFYSPITEGSIQVEFNFFEYGPQFQRNDISPYLFTGISGFGFNPKASYGDFNYELNAYATEGQSLNEPYKLINLSIPIGAGVKYNFTGNWNLIAEAGFRNTQTDYLDDVSGTYPDQAVFSGPGIAFNEDRKALSDPSVNKIGVPGTQRGDFRKRDTYLFVGFTLSYTFVTAKCYTF